MESNAWEMKTAAKKAAQIRSTLERIDEVIRLLNLYVKDESSRILVMELIKNAEEIIAVANSLNVLNEVYLSLEPLLKVSVSIEEIIRAGEEIASIKKLSCVAVTVESKLDARVEYNSANNTLKFFIPKGEKGSQGLQGIQGVQGIEGAKGIQGVQGEKGDKGDTGEQGAKGDKGDTGEQGAKGDPLRIDAYGKRTDRSLYDNATYGFTFLAIDEGLMYFKDVAEGIWTDGFAFGRGERGLQGEQGLKGDKGDRGDRGEQGLQGVKGEQGIQGLQGVGWDEQAFNAGLDEARTTYNSGLEEANIALMGLNASLGSQTILNAQEIGLLKQIKGE